MPVSLLMSVLSIISDLVSGFFAIIPQLIYFLFASVGSLLDVLQLVMRKLAGLDVYYINGQETSGDIITSFIEGILGINNDYSALNTVFWSLLIFSAILLILSTIFAIIKAHYNYDAKKSSSTMILAGSLKSLFVIAITPFIVMFGMYLSEIMLRTVDKITSPASSTQIVTIYTPDALQNIKSGSSKNGELTYTSYDVFGASEWTTGTTFSGVMFDVAAYNCNRVRKGSYTPASTPSNSNWDNCGIFYSEASGSTLREEVASQIDFAFINNIRLVGSHTVSLSGSEAGACIGSSLTFGPSAAFALGLINVSNFSKLNVGLVWYYYNLWGFNFFLSAAGIFTAAWFMIYLIFGLVSRLFTCVAIFLIYGPLAAISPLDGGNAFKSWRQTFLKNIISVYGAIVGMNIAFILLEFFQTITLFGVGILDRIFNMLVILAVLVMIKRFVALFSKIIGAEDLHTMGTASAKAAKEVALKGAKNTMIAGALGIGVGAYAFTGGLMGRTVGKAAKAINNSKAMTKFKNYAAEKYKGSKLESGVNSAKGFIKKTGEKVSGVATKFANSSFAKGAKKFGQGAVKVVGGALELYAGLNFGILSKPKEDEKKPADASKHEEKKDESNPTTTQTAQTEAQSDSQASTPAKPAKKERGKFAQSLVDLADAGLQLVGDLSGAKSIFKSLSENTQLVDETKTIVQSFYQAVGATDLLKAAQDGKSKLSTKQQKEKAEKDAVSEERSNIAQTSSNMQQIIQILNDAVKKMDDKK